MSERGSEGPDQSTEAGPDEREEDSSDIPESVERSFTCTLCGYAMVHEVPLLRAEVHGVCHNCGEWTAQQAGREDLAAAAREAATALAGPVLTERQALAYVLRELLDADRDIAAEVMDSSPSNVDNLERRGREKCTDAERVVDLLDHLREGAEESRDDAGAGDADQTGGG